MKKSTHIALHVTALAALSLAAGCQTIKSRGSRGSLLGGQPTEGDAVVLPGDTVDVTKPVPAAQPAPIVEQPALPAPAPVSVQAKPQAIRPVGEVGKPGTYPEFVNAPSDMAKQPSAHAQDVKVADLPKPVSSAEPMQARIPEQKPGAPALPKIVKTYTVAKGDTLSTIAQKNGVRTSDLLRVNSMADANKIRVGQKLNIPEPTPGVVVKPVTSKANANVVAPAGGSVHTVASGEYIGKIAHQYGLKTGDVLRANNLTEESAKKLKVGQKIIIPAKTAANTFTPKAADTPKISEVKVDLKPALPQTAPSLVVKPVAPAAVVKPTTPTPVVKPAASTPAVAPATAPAQAVAPAATPATAPAVPASPAQVKPVATAPAAPVATAPAPAQASAADAAAKTYVVKEGDDWSTIAKIFKTTTFDLLAVNGAQFGDPITPGQTIKLP